MGDASAPGVDTESEGVDASSDAGDEVHILGYPLESRLSSGSKIRLIFFGVSGGSVGGSGCLVGDVRFFFGDHRFFFGDVLCFLGDFVCSVGDPCCCVGDSVCKNFDGESKGVFPQNDLTGPLECTAILLRNC